MSATPIQTPEEVAVPRPRVFILFDPLLLVGALGLVACSLVTLKGATRNVIHGQPLYYVERQAVYVGIGLVVALILARLDYSRLREYKFGLYGLLIALNIVVFGMPAIRARTGGSRCRSSRCSPRSSASSCSSPLSPRLPSIARGA